MDKQLIKSEQQIEREARKALEPTISRTNSDKERERTRLRLKAARHAAEDKLIMAESYV